MFDHLNTGLGVLIAVLTLIALGVPAFVVAKASLTKAQKDLLRENNKDLVERLTLVEGENERLKAALEAAEARTTAAEDKIRVLEQVVTGRDQLDHLKVLLLAHDKQVGEKLDTLLETNHSG